MRLLRWRFGVSLIHDKTDLSTSAASVSPSNLWPSDGQVIIFFCDLMLIYYWSALIEEPAAGCWLKTVLMKYSLVSVDTVATTKIQPHFTHLTPSTLHATSKKEARSSYFSDVWEEEAVGRIDTGCCPMGVVQLCCHFAFSILSKVGKPMILWSLSGPNLVAYCIILYWMFTFLCNGSCGFL